jgi:L-lysine exporter family protein LysE/ArgO
MNFQIYFLELHLFGFSGYGLLRIECTLNQTQQLISKKSRAKRLDPTCIAQFSILTFANPHVYLDTVILIGSIAQQFSGELKVGFAIGASLASFVFFFGLAYGAKLLAPIMQNPNSWRILDGVITIIMFSIAFKLAVEGNWL